MIQQHLETEILIVGGGTSGVCAAIQAARLGVKTVLVEETVWLGGMLTAAGVSAVDGNHHLPSGLWGEFRRSLYDYYGAPEAVATGWVSKTLFEPHVGAAIFKNMVQIEPTISVFYGYWFIKVLKDQDRILGAVFNNDNGESLVVHAQITVDATEYGDVMAGACCEYRIGRESKYETGEPQAPEESDAIIQDLTYVAILKDFGEKANKTISKPINYNPQYYYGSCREACANSDTNVMNCETMLNYGRLPYNKFMINWPNNGNDFYVNVIEMSRAERIHALQAAKDFTLGWVYYMQTQLGLSNLGLADDEFPTMDRLALIPYNRESRRLKGKVRLTTLDVIDLYKSPQGKLYKMGIAVGDYPLDHHHKRCPKAVIEEFPKISAFNVPYGCLVPQAVDGLLVAEKNISVTHLVNGCTRLQPVVMQLGQAAGAAAALCVKAQIQPGAVNIRALQQQLIDAHCWLMPFCDVDSSDQFFQAVQRVGLVGIMKGEPISNAWENQMRFHPNRGITLYELNDAMLSELNIHVDFSHFAELSDNKMLSRQDAVNFIQELLRLRPALANVKTIKPIQNFKERELLYGLMNNEPDKMINRKELAFLFDITIDLFHHFPSNL